MGADKDYGSLIDLIPADQHKQVESMFKQISNQREFEVMFLNYRPDILMSLETFLNVLNYMTGRYRLNQNKMKISKNNSLDIAYQTNDKKLTTYRLSVNGIDQVNKLMGMFHMKRNHVIFTAVLAKYLQKEPGVELMKKVKDMGKIQNVDELKIRFRLSEENPVGGAELKELQHLTQETRSKIGFRYKERVSLVVHEDSEAQIQIDLTKVFSGNNINTIKNGIPRYELELEIVPKKGKVDSKYLAKVYHESELLLKIIQQSNFLINETLQKEVLKNYQIWLGVEGNRMYSLAGRQAYSLEIQHLVDILPNRFAVTDKADGDRFFLIIVNRQVFFINNNMVVKNTGITLPASKKNYDGTILDGELIYIRSKNRWVFMAFDCLRKGDDDLRGIQSFLERHTHLNQIIEECFVQNGDHYYTPKEFKGTFQADQVAKHYQKEIGNFLTSLNQDLTKDPQPLIRKKFFAPVLGGQKNEIFKYSKAMWEAFTRTHQNNCPYTLDGLVYHPLDQKYATSVKESKFQEYKWKPEDKNSIDFYITFERDRETNKEIILYDNSRDEHLKGKPYKICYLHVGKNTRNGEVPVMFQQESNRHIAYLFLERGEVRDQNGSILQDKTVVEFYYNTDPTVEERFRWIPLKTRYDKTETVMRHKKKYGNYIDIANRIWRSIITPVRFDDLVILSDDRLSESHIEKMRKKIDHTLILSERKENVYYQIKTNLALPMRNFHNFIKSIIIYTYFNQTYNHGQKMSILDIACGRGGDIMKFYYSRVAHYVGVDIDHNGLVASTDGALSRYRQLKKSHTNFPPMYFIHADARARLNLEDQISALGTMADQNRHLIQKFFPQGSNVVKFDGINCQFALHYFLESETTWNNFCSNIQTLLKPGGYVLFTCFDARRIVNALRGKETHGSHYTNEKGEKKLLFEIKKLYEEKEPGHVYGTGNAIDVHNSLISQEDVYNTEYLVDLEFIKKELSEKCDLELIESEYFDHVYYLNQEYFQDIEEHEGNPKTRKFLEKAYSYFQENEVNKACFEITRLNRYFIFRRRHEGKAVSQKTKFPVKKFDPTKKQFQKDASKSLTPVKPKGKRGRPKKMKGGGYSLENLSHLLGDNFFLGEVEEAEKSLYASVASNLRTARIIPGSVTTTQLYEDLEIPVHRDQEVDMKDFHALNKIQIHHQEDEKERLVLNGIDLFVLEEDCNGDAEVFKYPSPKRKNKKAMILYHDGSQYRPVYYRRDRTQALFPLNDQVVQSLEEAM